MFFPNFPPSKTPPKEIATKEVGLIYLIYFIH